MNQRQKERVEQRRQAEQILLATETNPERRASLLAILSRVLFPDVACFESDDLDNFSENR